MPTWKLDECRKINEIDGLIIQKTVLGQLVLQIEK